MTAADVTPAKPHSKTVGTLIPADTTALRAQR
jgi:hypothetical protein